MGAYVQASIEPEDIIYAMNEDTAFTFDMWFELADKLNMGLLLDNACDVSSNDMDAAKYVANNFEMLVNLIRSRHDELVTD